MFFLKPQIKKFSFAKQQGSYKKKEQMIHLSYTIIEFSQSLALFTRSH
jgi:hypothetical protein